MNSAAPDVVQIGRPKAPLSILEKLNTGPVADKFFVIASFAAFIGMASIGAHLWLMLHGQMDVSSSYAQWKYLHALCQLYLFLGMCVLGFSLQATPKLLGSNHIKANGSLLLIPILVFGVTIAFIWPKILVGQTLIASTFVFAVVYVLRVTKDAAHTACLPTSLLLCGGLTALALSPYFELNHTLTVLVFFWAGIGLIILAAGQQFIAGFLGGERIRGRSGAIFAVSCLLSSLFGLSLIYFPSSGALRLWASLIFLLLCSYLALTKLWKTYISAEHYRSPLGIAYLFAYLWALVGAALLAIYGTLWTDLVFHIWATGWATTLILAISCQVIGYLSGGKIINNSVLYAFIIIWQTVPLGRGLLHNYAGALFSWIIAIVSTVVITTWMIGLIFAEVRLLRRY